MWWGARGGAAALLIANAALGVGASKAHRQTSLSEMKRGVVALLRSSESLPPQTHTRAHRQQSRFLSSKTTTCPQNTQPQNGSTVLRARRDSCPARNKVQTGNNAFGTTTTDIFIQRGQVWWSRVHLQQRQTWTTSAGTESRHVCRGKKSQLASIGSSRTIKNSWRKSAAISWPGWRVPS